MNKRILTLVLAFVMILGLAVTSFAAPEAEKITNPKVQWLIDKNIVVGRLQDDGKTTVYDLDKTITREEVAKLVILYRGSENLARSLQGTKGIFKDVAIDRWSNGYINVAALADLIVGYPDGNFGPDKDITYAEIAAILVRMNSKWTAADEKAAIWPISFIKAAEEFGILKGIKLEDANAPAVREKVFEMMYNAFDGKYQAPIVNDRLGVISKIWGNSIQLNGKDEYKVTDKTIFVGNTLKKLFIADDFYGALVRIAVNDDNEITHLVALGSNGFAYEKDKWDGLIDPDNGHVYVVKGDYPNPADISDKSNNDEVVFLGKLTLKITDKTRFFVADTDNNNFFEAKKLTDAIDTKKVEHLTGVYAAYDVQPVTGVQYARVVVFSSGKEADLDKNLVRVTENVYGSNGNYSFKAENTKAVETEYDVASINKFPADYGFDKMDVISLSLSGDNTVKNAVVKIDYSKASVYEVLSVTDRGFNYDGTRKFEGSKIELKDEFGATQVFALKTGGVNVFTNGLNKGAHVQVAFDKDDHRIIEIISKVEKELAGALPAGTPGNKVCGKIEKVSKDGQDQLVWLKVKDGGSAPVPFRVDEAEVKAALGITDIKDAVGRTICALKQDFGTNERAKLIGIVEEDADAKKACDDKKKEAMEDVFELRKLNSEATGIPADLSSAKPADYDKILAAYKALKDKRDAIVVKMNANDPCYVVDQTEIDNVKANIDAYDKHLKDIKEAEEKVKAHMDEIKAIDKEYSVGTYTTAQDYVDAEATATAPVTHTVTDNIVGDINRANVVVTLTGIHADWEIQVVEDIDFTVLP